MVIRVQYENGKFDMVKATRLDDLLPQGNIAAFQRRNGWVTVGKEATRSTLQQEYSGPERRGVDPRLVA